MIRYEDIEKIHVELSSACNAACPVCPRNLRGGAPVTGLAVGTLSVYDFQKIIGDDMLPNLKKILFCGRYGDPAFCKDLPGIIDYIRRFNQTASITMHTNGGIRSPEWWRGVAKHENFDVIFSFDGLADTNHIYRRNVNWARAWENALAFIEGGGNANWEFLVFRHNQHQIEEARELAKLAGFNKFQLKRPYGFDILSGANAELVVEDHKGNVEYSIYPSDNEDLVNTVWHTKSSKEKPQMRDYDAIEIDCHAVKQNEIYVDALGQIFPCCWLAYAGQSEIDPGSGQEFVSWVRDQVGLDNINALKRPLREILESDYFDQIAATWKKSHNNGRIQTCTEMCGRDKNLRKRLLV